MIHGFVKLRLNLPQVTQKFTQGHVTELHVLKTTIDKLLFLNHVLKVCVTFICVKLLLEVKDVLNKNLR